MHTVHLFVLGHANTFVNHILTHHFHSLSLQDEHLKKIVGSLHPTLANACLAHISPDTEKIRSIDWTAIAAHLRLTKMDRLKTNPNTYCRKSAECMRRFVKLSGAAKGGAEKLGASKGPWTEEEDEKVRELVGLYGPKRWSQIAAELPGELMIAPRGPWVKEVKKTFDATGSY